MNSYQTNAALFEKQFAHRHFPSEPAQLYDASQYILQIAGKRVRPVAVLMGNELFDELHRNVFDVANAVEVFHNFSLIHDDIMDKAPLRRGLPTVHHQFGENTAILAGDVMLVKAYEYLSNIDGHYITPVLNLFNRTAREVCEGQQVDVDFESREHVSFDEYLQMITLKTSVLLASCLQLGAILGGASAGNQRHMYEFGKNLGIAFQVQDDYLDCFGDPEKFGKQVGGDILANKKTFLHIHAWQVADEDQKKRMRAIIQSGDENKVGDMLQLYRDCKVDEWANELKSTFYNKALGHLDDIAVLAARKQALRELAAYLLERDS
jgi:geranylgeranyl diphosphate synthase type II